MRTSLVRAPLASAGATFRERHGVEVVSHLTDRPTEYRAVRDAVALTDFSFVQKYRVPEEKGVDFLDALMAGNVAKIRFGRVLHTLLANADGEVVGDCFVANNDTELILLCESLLPDAELAAQLEAAGAAAAGVEDMTADHALFSLDGFRAWEVAKEVFGADVLGLPYLSIEVYPFGGQTVRLFRAGKTSEFGYLILAPQATAGELFETLTQAVARRDGRLCGVDVHDDLRLEGRFFNLHAEGQRVRDPLALGLQWMVDFDKESFRGSEAIRRRRAAGLKQKVVGVATAPGCEALQTGARVFHEGQPVAEVVASCHSYVLDQRLGLALFPNALAYSGLAFRLTAPDGPIVRTISMPPIMPRSLKVKLDEM